MAKNIMILFLSDVKRDWKTGVVTAFPYNNLGSGDYKMAKTTNESAVKYLLLDLKQKHERIDKMYVIASKMIRNAATDKDYTFVDSGYAENPTKKWTHLEYFIDRIRPFIPDIDDILRVCNYDEDAPIQDSMQAVVDVAKEVQKYINEVGKVVVHADFTGGMRHANLVMLDAIRLLQYDTRVSLGKILYSNFNANPKKVEEANSVYGLVDLISGAEEFVRFGSVNSLQQYYKEKEVSAELGRVLKAMEDFAEAIRLCHYGSFTKSITDLRSALQAFDSHMESVELQNDAKGLNDKFMARLESRIRENYGVLLQGTGNDKINDLDLIKWCVDNGYLQQALTLYIERVPEVIYADNKLIELTDNGEGEFKDQYNAKHNELRSPSVYLITAFKNKTLQSEIDQMLAKVYKKGIVAFQIITKAAKKVHDSIKYNRGMGVIDLDSESKACLKLLKNNLQDNKDLILDERKLAQSVKDLLKMVEKQQISTSYIEEAYKKAVKKDYAKKYGDQHQDELKEKQKNERKEIKNKAAEEHIRQTYDVLSEPEKVQVIFQFLAGHLTAEAAQKIFPVLYFDVANSRDIVEFIKEDKIKSNIPVPDLEKILDRYGVLKNERNHSNHARADASEFTAESLGKEIKKGLADLRAAIQSIQ